MLTSTRRAHGGRGFSLVELVVTITVIAVLGAFVSARFVGKDTFESRGFFDQATGVVRYAQKTAVAWRNTPVFVCVTGNAVSAGIAAGCSPPLAHPVVSGAELKATAPSGVTLSPVGNFTFDGAGRPSASQTIVVSSSIAGDPARKIVVEAETGYVHQ